MPIAPHARGRVLAAVPPALVCFALGLPVAFASTTVPHASSSGESLAAPSAAAVSAAPGQLLVKLVDGADIGAVNRRLGSTTRSVLLASRSLYLIDVPLENLSNDPAKARKNWAKQAKGLLNTLDKDPSIVYAEVNLDAGITEDDRFHYWPIGGPDCLGTDPASFFNQSAAAELRLAQVHRIARGAGRTIAVLDTGLDAAHPAFSGHIAVGGYDYVDDDAHPTEVRAGIDHDGDGATNEGYGHGTFVSGIALLVAPDAKILPQRVLDSEGRGNIFVVAEAIYDAVDAGADVVNLSFGTTDRVASKTLRDAVEAATKAGVVVVAAAGNDGSSSAHYPAALTDVISVAAETSDRSELASFSARGKWVDIAAPGEQVVSTLPCGYASWSGTSMAAPFVAGGAAVLGGRRPGASPAQLLKALGKGSDKVRGMEVATGAINLLRSLDRMR